MIDLMPILVWVIRYRPDILGRLPLGADVNQVRIFFMAEFQIDIGGGAAAMHDLMLALEKSELPRKRSGDE